MKEETKSKADACEDQIAKIKEEKQALLEKKHDVKENYYKALLEFELEDAQCKQADYIKRKKEELKDYEKKIQERLEEKKQTEVENDNPYSKEIDTCEHLIQYCHKMRVQYGQVEQGADDDIKESEKMMQNQFAKEKIQEKIKEGKLEAVQSKKDREEEATFFAGGKKKKGKNQKKKKEEFVDANLNLDIGVIKNFSFLKVSPPTDPEQLEAKVEELKKKKEEYAKLGEESMGKQEHKSEEQLRKEVEEEMKHEQARFHDRGDGDRRGGGRGGRGSRGGGRGGRGRGDRPPRRHHDDEEGGAAAHSEEEEEHKPSPKEHRPRKQKLEMNEESFPQLS